MDDPVPQHPATWISIVNNTIMYLVVCLILMISLATLIKEVRYMLRIIRLDYRNVMTAHPKIITIIAIKSVARVIIIVLFMLAVIVLKWIHLR